MAAASCLFALLLLAVPTAASPTVLRVCDDVVEPLTLDPRREFSEKNHTLIQQIFEGLVRFDPEGRIEPALAESWRQVDPLTLEFRLRAGVTFHDGERFNAEAARFSVWSFADPQGSFPGAALFSSIENVQAIDDLTLRVRTRYPDGVLLHRLAGLVTMLPPAYIAKHGSEAFARRPVGTGPFRFVEWERGSRIALEANPSYWKKGYPRFKRLEFYFLPVERQVAGLLDGTIDIVTELPGTDTLKVMRSGVAHVIKKESFYTVGGSINISSSPLSDRRVRRALNHAIDRDALVRYDLLGNGKPLASLAMKGEIGYNNKLRPYRYDLQKARRLLKEAGYPNGVRLRAVVKAQGERTMRIVASQLKKAGIEVETTLTTDATVLQDIRSGTWDFTFGGCPDPLAHTFFIQSIFLSSRSPYSIMRNPEYDQRLEAMVGTLDPVEQQKSGEELDRYIHEEALSVFTYQRLKTYGVRRGVRFVPWITGMPYFDLSEPADG